MPLVPIAMAAGAWALGGAAAAGTLLSGGIAALTMTEAFALTAAVGATLSAVGAVVHDKTLSTVGMVIGGIGGVGAIANAAGAFGANATVQSVFGGEAAAATGAAGAPTVAAAAGDSVMNGAASAAAPGVETVTVTGVAPTAMSGGDIFSDLAALGQMGSPATATDASKDPSKDPLAAKVAAPDASAPAAGSKATAPTDTTAPQLDNVSGATPPPAGAPAGPPSLIPTTAANKLALDFPNPGEGAADTIDGVRYAFTGGKWAKDAGGGLMSFLGTQGGGMLGMGVVQAASSFLSGATDTLKPAQVAGYQAQAAANNAAAALAKRQNDNMSSALPTARRMPVTGKIGMMDSTPGARVA